MTAIENLALLAIAALRTWATRAEWGFWTGSGRSFRGQAENLQAQTRIQLSATWLPALPPRDCCVRLDDGKAPSLYCIKEVVTGLR